MYFKPDYAVYFAPRAEQRAQIRGFCTKFAIIQVLINIF